MKKLLLAAFLGALSGSMGFAPILSADQGPVVAPDQNLVTQSPEQPVDKMNLEGWINKINYVKSEFFMRDYRGFETKVKVKEGNINDYKLGDKVKVKIREDRRAAEMIEKLYQ